MFRLLDILLKPLRSIRCSDLQRNFCHQKFSHVERREKPQISWNIATADFDVRSVRIQGTKLLRIQICYTRSSTYVTAVIWLLDQQAQKTEGHKAHTSRAEATQLLQILLRTFGRECPEDAFDLFSGVGSWVC